MTLKKFVSENHRFIAAHRGASHTHPENTIAAFVAAIDCGASMIEADVQFTADGVPIIFHDEALDRTANGNGLIGHTNYSELKKLSVGSWFDNIFSSETIPTLLELIDLLKGKAFLGLEIKPSNSNKHQIEIITDLLKKENFENSVIFASFHYNVLKDIKSIDNNLHTAAIKIPNDNSNPIFISKEFFVDSYICSIDEINYQIVSDCKDAELVLGAYSIDSIESFNKAIEFDVRGIGTNNPCLISNLLDEC